LAASGGEVGAETPFEVTIAELKNWFTRRTSRQGASHKVEVAE
jgi:hypothetical protein